MQVLHFDHSFNEEIAATSTGSTRNVLFTRYTTCTKHHAQKERGGAVFRRKWRGTRHQKVRYREYNATKQKMIKTFVDNRIITITANQSRLKENSSKNAPPQPGSLSSFPPCSTRGSRSATGAGQLRSTRSADATICCRPCLVLLTNTFI